jgi:acyl carrier protein
MQIQAMEHHETKIRPMATDRRLSARDIERWLVDALSRHLQRAPDAIGTEIAFADMGVDSLMAIAITNDLEHLLRERLDATVMFAYPSIATLAAHLRPSQG